MHCKFASFLISILLIPVIIGTPDYKTQSGQDYFTIAVLPDTQFYAESYPAIFDQQAQWIVDNAQSQNIVFVAHLGDLQDDYNNLTEWGNARHSMDIIRAAGIPYSVVPGNHDLNFDVGDSTNFDLFFPYTDFTGYSWYGGHYPENSNTSNYELFSAMGQDYIVLNPVCFNTLLDDATAWANGVLTQYSDRKAIIITHTYIDTEGNHISASNTAGIAIWNNIVRWHNNVIAVFCGHTPGESYSTDIGFGGNRIYNFLTDYSDLNDGGDGWLRLYQFYPRLNKISVITYSPYLNKYDITSYGQFDLDLDMRSSTKQAPNWDLNGDHKCNIGDAVILGLVWGQTGSPGWIPGDLNSDGIISIRDIVFIGLHWGETW
jgi:3',5'-cyclic AMP phosphodiesterase CpdA